MLALPKIPAKWKQTYREMAEMSSMACLVLSIPSYCCLFMLCCAFPPFWPFIVGYIIYIWVDQSPENGSSATRYSPWFRSIFMWKNFASYFPITLHKTVELEPAFVTEAESDSEDDSYRGHHDSDDQGSESDDLLSHRHRHRNHQEQEPRLIWKLTFWWYYLLKPSSSHYHQKRPTGRKYIFGFHPHGIISMGALGAIATEGAGWSQKFPGIPVSVLTLANQFIIPFYREMLLAMGMGSVSKHNCESLLDRNQSICIIVGGAQESLFARPGKLDLVLNKRRGFIKLAIESYGDVNLVPVLAFGENDIYEQVDNSKGTWLFRLQTAMKNIVGFTIPLLHARGVFNYDVGIMPYRRPINVVVGEPISVQHEPHPPPQLVDRVHAEYVAKLRKLYETNRERFVGPDGTYPKLQIVE